MNRHLLLVGDPGPVAELVRAQRDALVTVTALCRTADIPRFAGLRHVNRILATGPQDESCEAWTSTAVLAHRVSAMTHAAVLDPHFFSRAAHVADVLGIDLYPRSNFRAIHDHWALRQRLRAAGDDVGATLVPDRGALLSSVAEHGLPCLLRSRQLDRPAAVLRSLEMVEQAADGAIEGIAPGPGILVEPAGDSSRLCVAVLAEGGRSVVLAMLRQRGDREWVAVQQTSQGDPEPDDEAVRSAPAYAVALTETLGVLDGLLLLDLGTAAAGQLTVNAARLGLPSRAVCQAVLRASGVDVAVYCARQCAGQPALDPALEAARAFAETARPPSCRSRN